MLGCRLELGMFNISMRAHWYFFFFCISYISVSCTSFLMLWTVRLVTILKASYCLFVWLVQRQKPALLYFNMTELIELDVFCIWCRCRPRAVCNVSLRLWFSLHLLECLPKHSRGCELMLCTVHCLSSAAYARMCWVFAVCMWCNWIGINYRTYVHIWLTVHSGSVLVPGMYNLLYIGWGIV